MPSVRQADPEGPLRVELTRSSSRPRTTGICAFLPFSRVQTNPTRSDCDGPKRRDW